MDLLYNHVVKVFFHECVYTLFDVLIAVEWLDGIILAQAPKGIDEVGAEVRVDVLRGELCIPLSEIIKGLQSSLLAIYAPMIYTAPCIMFWMRAYPLWGQVGGGWALEI